jgi:propanol-preferring alcohol dehydrogenase
MIPATMTAIRYKSGTNVPLKVEIPVPEPGPGEVLLKVSATGLCHSDVSFHYDERKGHSRVNLATSKLHVYTALKPILPPDIEFTVRITRLAHPFTHLITFTYCVSQFGHEDAGVPVKLDPGVTNIKLGQLYAIYPINPCLSTDPAVYKSCACGMENLCQVPGRAWYGLGFDGSWAEYMKVAAKDLVAVPASLPAEVGCDRKVAVGTLDLLGILRRLQ